MKIKFKTHGISLSFIVGGLILGFYPSQTQALPPPQTIPATSCSLAHVQAAIAAAQNGDTVTVPAGSCSWTSTFNLSKAVTLMGSGVGSTIITDAIALGAVINVELVANQTTRISGFEFRDGGARPDLWQGATINVGSTVLDARRIRIDHNKFDHLKSYPNISATKVYGVVDHNEFLNTMTNRALNITQGSINDLAGADNSWATPPNFGSDQFLFVEDNIMTYDPGTFYAHTDCTVAGCRLVVRYNTITRGWIEAHGTDSSARSRGGRAIEVYNNNFIDNTNLSTTVTNARSGTWVIHDNSIIGINYGNIGPSFVLGAYRLTQGYSPFGGADGTNPWDKNVPGGPFLSGTVSSAGSDGGFNTVTVNGANWTTDQWKHYSIRKTSGAKSCSSLTHTGGSQPLVTAVCNGHGFVKNDFITMGGGKSITI